MKVFFHILKILFQSASNNTQSLLVINTSVKGQNSKKSLFGAVSQPGGIKIIFDL